LKKGCSFRSFFLGGFECSTHRLRDGKRLDVICATGHDRFADQDYQRLRSIGIETARDGVRWHLIESSPRKYDFTSAAGMVRAAAGNEVQVIWDLCHYGWPDDIDIFSAEFVDRFAEFAWAFAQFLKSEAGGTPYFTPVNEISFFAWAAGEVGYLNPFGRGRGDELKRQLVRANLAAAGAIRDISPEARFVHVDPLIRIATDPFMSAAQINRADDHMRSSFTAWDMIAGRTAPELGGCEDYFDIVGANYYVHNQWVYEGKFLEPDDPRYVPLHELLANLHKRYERPLFIAETGIEDHRRPQWLRYVCDEVIAALRAGIPIEGICLYPIVNHPGWDDGRHCHNGLWDYCNDCGSREVYKPLADELARQQVRIDQVRSEIDRDCSSAGVFV
jgi:beta-glucosidase/6-phospho-beta-glucosidase/beta-galactosidase